MAVRIDCSGRSFELPIAPARLIAHLSGPPTLPEVGAVVRQALESPFDFPALRQAVTADDRIALVVDETVPDLATVLLAVLEHLASAGIEQEAITLICASPSPSRPWLEAVRPAFAGVQVEDHDPGDRARLAYLAATSAGRRLYLSRTLVDADQIVVVSERRYDPILGYGGAEGALFPALSDEPTRASLLAQVRTEPPGDDPWPVRREAVEASWLLGQPFHVQVIGSADGGIAGVIAGAVEACREGDRLLDASWRFRIPRRADVIAVGLAGDGGGCRFADLAAAVGAASRVVQPAGRIIVLGDIEEEGVPGMEVLRAAEDPQAAVEALVRAAQPGSGPALQWARAVCHARVSLLGNLPGGMVEEMFATPLDDPAQVQRLVDAGQDCLVVSGGQRALILLG